MENKIADAFRRGFIEEASHQYAPCRTARAVAKRHTDYSTREITAYLNGAEDERNRDSFRWNLLEELGL